MAANRSFEIGTGLFILLGFAALLFLATQTTNMAGFKAAETYQLSARFTNIGQLKERAPVKLAGVTIGTVRSITLDGTALDAVVHVDVDRQYSELPEDSSLSILTSGLLGDQYLAIRPGAAQFLVDGDEFLLTESSLQLEELIGKFMVGGTAAPTAATDRAGPATAFHRFPKSPIAMRMTLPCTLFLAALLGAVTGQPRPKKRPSPWSSASPPPWMRPWNSGATS